MREATHIRKGHLIMSIAGIVLRDCKTINAGKRESRRLQKEEGAVVRVEPHKSKPQVRAARAPNRLQRLRAIETANNDQPRFTGTARDFMQDAIAKVDRERSVNETVKRVSKRHNWSKGGKS